MDELPFLGGRGVVWPKLNVVTSASKSGNIDGVSSVADMMEGIEIFTTFDDVPFLSAGVILRPSLDISAAAEQS